MMPDGDFLLSVASPAAEPRGLLGGLSGTDRRSVELRGDAARELLADPDARTSLVGDVSP